MSGLAASMLVNMGTVFRCGAQPASLSWQLECGWVLGGRAGCWVLIPEAAWLACRGVPGSRCFRGQQLRTPFFCWLARSSHSNAPRMLLFS
jgi:hypothetical protein